MESGGTMSPAQRIIRSQRVFRRAAEILERDAGSLKDSFANGGEWETGSPYEIQAKEDHDEMMAIAADLRRMAGGA